MTTDGRVVAPDKIMGLYDRTLIPSGSGVDEFHIRQASVGTIDVLARVRLGGEAEATQALDAFTAGVRRLLSDEGTTVSIQIVNEIPTGFSHKRRLVTNAPISKGGTPCP